MDEQTARGISRREALTRLGSAGAGFMVLGPGEGWRWAGFSFAGRAAELAIAALGPDTLRITVLPAGLDQPGDPVPLDGSLVPRTWAPDVVLSTTGQEVEAGEFRLAVSLDPVRVRISRPDGRLVQQLELEADGSVTFNAGQGPLLGLGQGGPQFDRRGAAYRMRSGQGGYQLRTHGSRVPIQWLVSTDGWSLWIHQPLGAFDLMGSRGRFTPPSAAPLPLDLFVVDAAEPHATMAEWARLTGPPELPPRWAFGYLQSHRTLAGPDEVRWVARTFREKRLPCDALIYLGTGFTPSGWNTNNGEFAWNPATFPDPDGMLKELHELHFRVVLHAVLEGRRLNGTVSDPCPKPPSPGETGSGRQWPEAQDVACYWPIHKPIVDQGVDGWWPDQGDGLDAASRLNRIRMYWDGMLQYRPDERPFALHRNGHTGMARYAPFLWSGDVQSTWETLRTHVPVAINTGLSGIPFWGTDIGGFVPTPEYTGELHVRWFQFGAFCPLFRAHGRTWHLRLPFGWETGELGHDEVGNAATAYPDPAEFRNPQVEPICKQYLELRYRLLPYLYTAVREVHDAGLPIMRALWLHYPDDPAAAARGDEYLWGRDILVAPVVEQGARSRNVYLPAGGWYDFWTEQPHPGGQEITRAVDLATLPLFVRAGAIIPLGPVLQYSDEPSDGALTLTVYPGADGRAGIYEDDGHSLGYRRGQWSRLLLEWDDAARRLTIRPDSAGALAPAHRPVTVRVAGESGSRQLIYQGNQLVTQL